MEEKEIKDLTTKEIPMDIQLFLEKHGEALIRVIPKILKFWEEEVEDEMLPILPELAELLLKYPKEITGFIQKGREAGL